MFQQVQDEFLGEILRYGFTMAPRADELLEGRPIAAADVLQRLPSGGFTA